MTRFRLLSATVVVGLIPCVFAAAPSSAGDKKAGATPEARLRELKIELPAVEKSKNTLVSAVLVGDMLYVSGHGPGKVDGKGIVGRLGQDMSVKDGQAAARRVGLQILAVVKQELGS